MAIVCARKKCWKHHNELGCDSCLMKTQGTCDWIWKCLFSVGSITSSFCLQAYHSTLMDSDTKLIGNMALLPIRSQFKGPAPRESEFIIISELLDVAHHLRGCSKPAPARVTRQVRGGKWKALQFREEERSFQLLQLCKS